MKKEFKKSYNRALLGALVSSAFVIAVSIKLYGVPGTVPDLLFFIGELLGLFVLSSLIGLKLMQYDLKSKKARRTDYFVVGFIINLLLGISWLTLIYVINQP